MPNPLITSVFQVRTRFLRSAHLERDFDDPTASRGYVLTRQAEEHFRRLTSGLSKGSAQRAWRITGDYGVGKSSFALLLAQYLAGHTKAVSTDVNQRLQQVSNGHHRLLPILVTGSRDPISLSVAKALISALDKLHTRGRRPRIYERLENVIRESCGRPLSDPAVVELIAETAAFISDANHGDGLLIILDELGKFLEYAANNPDRQDIYFLQLLGEAASRSGETPLMVVGLLHQGFNAYADRLSESAQREWQKVAGRFEEIIFDRPLYQTASLIASALNIPLNRLPKPVQKRAREDMAKAVKLGWYGSPRFLGELEAVSPSLYPLHPSLLPVVARLFARFGQNERSLFSFLMSTEPFALQAFAEQSISPSTFYRIHDLYDYARATIGHRLSAQSYRNHWNLIESVVESFATEQIVELRVLKTVAMLNLVDDQGLLATAEAIELAVAVCDEDSKSVKQALASLQKRRVLYARGSGGGYCLWPHTSVNIDKAYEDARKATGLITSVTPIISNELDARPVVARRHYIETGNLRHFAVRATPVTALDDVLSGTANGDPDGVIVLPLCETVGERQVAIAFAQSERVKACPQVLIAIPRPLETLANMVSEVIRWQWVQDHTPELIHDRYAADEVSRQLAGHRQILRDRIQSILGLRTFSADSELTWYREGKVVGIASSRDLLSQLSTLCDRVFDQAPTVRNELINRRSLSSAAASARMRLIEKLFSGADEPFLGLDTTKKPPEMSMYLSVLQNGRMHVKQGSRFGVSEPHPSDDPLNLRPTFGKFLSVLKENRDARIRLSDIFAVLRSPPFGVRDGLMLLLLAVFAVVHEEDLAFYEDGAFLRTVGPEEFLRLSKSPSSFELQYCRVSGVRTTVFNELVALLAPGDRSSKTPNVLDVVRPLCLFAAQLPRYTQRTKHISPEAAAVRASLIAAKEPARLVFNDLPLACGYEPFDGNSRAVLSKARPFVAVLKKSLDELEGVYPGLLKELDLQVGAAFEQDESPTTGRERLATTAEKLLKTVHEAKLRGFCLRLADRNLSHAAWMEALAGFLSGKPPSHWLDTDIHVFREELFRQARTFLRVEAAAFSPGAEGSSYSVRLALTMGDGSDVERVVRLAPGEELLAKELEAKLREAIGKSKNVGLAAISRLLWSELGNNTVR